MRKAWGNVYNLNFTDDFIGLASSPQKGSYLRQPWKCEQPQQRTHFVTHLLLVYAVLWLEPTALHTLRWGFTTELGYPQPTFPNI